LAPITVFPFSFLKFLRGRLLHDLLVEIPLKAGFSGLEPQARRIHLPKNFVQVAGLGLRNGGRCGTQSNYRKEK
jgi:hypothetical protein